MKCLLLRIIPYISFLTLSNLLIGQELNLNELQIICSMTDYTEVDRFLRAKGWVYHDSKQGDNTHYNTITWAHSKNRYDDRAAAWFYLFAYDDVPNKINYQYHKASHNTVINNSIISLGYKKMDGNILDGNVVTKYQNNNFIAGLRYSQSDDSDYNSKMTTYNITLIKKSGIFDEDNGKKVSYFWEGQKKEDYTLKNGKLHGEYTQYNSNCYVIIKSNYSNGILSGPFKLYHENGILKTEGTKVNDKNHGYFKEYDENGTLIFECQMLNGEPNGLLKSYWPNGKLKRTGNFKDGEELGYFKEYSESGLLEFEGELKGDSLNGSYKFYHENGKIKYSGAKKNGISYGPIKEHFESGKISYDYSKKDNELDGVFLSYYENGIIEEKGNYKNAKKDGTFLKYDTSGNSILEENYLLGVLNGKFKNYWNNGKVLLEGNYLNGFKDGIWYYFDEKGRQSGSEEFKSGKKNGKDLEYVYYEENNSKIEILQFYLEDLKHGRNEINVITDSSKRLIIYGNYAYDKKNGDFQEISGDSVIICTYKNDKLEGNYLIYRDLLRYLFGNPINTDTSEIALTEKGQYLNDCKNGYWTYFDMSGRSITEEGKYFVNQKEGPWKYYYHPVLDNDGGFLHYSSELYRIEYYNKGDLYKTEKFSWFDQVIVPCPIEEKKDTCFEEKYTKIHEVCEYKNKIPNGFYQLKDSVGNLITKGNLLNNKKNSEWEFVSWNGNKKIQKFIQFNLDKYEGTYKEFVDGVIVMEGRFKNNLENGLFNYFINGNLYASENYVNGILNGDKKEYNPLGKIVIYENYENGSLKKLEKYSFEDPNIKEFEAEVFLTNGLISNLKAIFYKSDSIINSDLRIEKDDISFEDIKNGNKHGEYLLKVKDQLRIKGSYFYNKKDGNWFYYFPEDNVEARFEFSENNLKSEVYINTLKLAPYSGKVTFINSEKNEKEIVTVKNGLRHGDTKFFSGLEKKPFKKISYKNGTLVSE